MGAAEDVELDVQPGEISCLRLIVMGGQFLDAAFLLLGCLDGCDAVVVATTDEADVRTGGAEVADVGVGGEVGTGDVAYVEPAVGIGQGCCDEEPSWSHSSRLVEVGPATGVPLHFG